MIGKFADIKSNFYFADPIFLGLSVVLAVIFLLWFGVVVVNRIKRPRQTYGSKYPIIGKIKFWGFFVIPAGGLMILALAKPSLNQGTFKMSRGDVEVSIVIDRSISMRADDLKPSRLDIAKREASNIESFLAEGDKTALYVFGEESHRKIYLSERSENTFGRLAGVMFPESLTGDGLIWNSSFASMLENVYQSLDRQDKFLEGYSGSNYVPKKRSNRIVIIFTDGEDPTKTDKPTTEQEASYQADYIKRLDAALKEFKRRGLKIYPVGIGTVRGVAAVSLLRGYKKNVDYEEALIGQWQGEISRLDKNNLISLARSTGVDLSGYVWAIQNNAATVKDYLRDIIRLNRRSLLEFSQSEGDQDMWQYFIIAAVVVLSLGILFYPISGYLRRKTNR